MALSPDIVDAGTAAVIAGAGAAAVAVMTVDETVGEHNAAWVGAAQVNLLHVRGAGGGEGDSLATSPFL